MISQVQDLNILIHHNLINLMMLVIQQTDLSHSY